MTYRWLSQYLNSIVCHNLPGDTERGGSGKPVTNSDMGLRGLKIAVFTVTSFLNDPYKQYYEMNAPLGKNGLI